MKAILVKLVDIFLLLLVTAGSTKWIEFVGGSGAAETRTKTTTVSNLAEVEFGNPGFHQTHFHHRSQDNRHPHPFALPFSLSQTTQISSTDPPSYLAASVWLRYTSDDDGESDNGNDANNNNYKSVGAGAKLSDNFGNNNNINMKNYNNNNNNSSLALMSEVGLMSSGNESVDGYFGGATFGPNDTLIHEMDEEEEGEVFEAEVPWWRQMIWSILFGAMVMVACTGNVTVIWIVLAHKRMRTVTNYLLVNLSIADAMSSTLNVIPNYSYMLTGHWPFGFLYCKIVQFVSMLSICASVFSLMAIAFDRYMAIMNPLRPRMGKRLTLGIAAGIWIGGTILSMPMLIFFQTYEKIHSDGESQVICYSEWPDGPQTESYQEYLYNVFFMIFTYFIPIAVMGYTYTRVGIELWGSKSIGECTQRQLDNIKSKRRVVKMMIVVVSIFAFCWLPFHMYFIWVSLWPITTTYSFVQEVYLGIYWLAMSNSMYNPIIYCWMNNRFRRGFQQVFRWCPFVHYSEVEATTAYMMHTQRERETTRIRFCAHPPTRVDERHRAKPIKQVDEYEFE